MNYEGTKKWLSRTWTSGYFNSQNGARPNSRIEQHSDSGSESENEKNLDSDSASEEDEKDEEPTIKKKKALNSSDEEWCPEPKKSKPKKKKVARRLSSSEDDMAEQDQGNVSDAVDEDYSEDENPTKKRSKKDQDKILKFLNKTTVEELMTVETISAVKGRNIMENRPYSSLRDFRTKIEVIKGMNNPDQIFVYVEECIKGFYSEIVQSLDSRLIY